MDASENSGTPKSSIFNRIFHYKPSILGVFLFLETPIYWNVSFPGCKNDHPGGWFPLEPAWKNPASVAFALMPLEKEGTALVDTVSKVATWRIIPFSTWLITMVSKSPNWGCSLYKWPKWLINGGDPNHLLTGMILQVWWRGGTLTDPYYSHSLQTFQIPKMEVLTYMSCTDTAYVRENPQDSFVRFSTSILGTWNSWWHKTHWSTGMVWVPLMGKGWKLLGVPGEIPDVLEIALIS